MNTRTSGIYYNSSAEPVFLEGRLIGGHEYVFVEGFLRLPGHFVAVQDPQDDPNAPETFRQAYSAMQEKAAQSEKETHQATNNSRSNVVPLEDEKDAEEAPSTPQRASRASSRKGKRETSSDGAGDQ